MQVTTGDPAPTDLAAVLDELLHSVSHDLRSPLLTISLGAELIADAVTAGDERAALALDSLRSGAKDLERLLDAVTLIARARRRPLEDAPITLAALLRKHVTTTQVEGAESAEDVRVRVDPRIVAETMAAVGPQEESPVSLRVEESMVHLGLCLPDGTPECEGSPLVLLMGALRVYAGTAIARVGALQAQLERQGGTMTASGGRLRVSLPRARRSA